MTTSSTQPGPVVGGDPGVPGRHRHPSVWPKVILAVLAAALIGVAVTVLVVTVSGQSAQIGQLKAANAGQQGQIAQLTQAQASADAAAKTRAGAAVANLGVCVDTTYGYGSGVSYVQGMTIASPTVKDGAVSCDTGRFVPVTPQPAQHGG